MSTATAKEMETAVGLLDRQETRTKPPGLADVGREGLLAARLAHFAVPIPPAHPIYDRILIFPLDDLGEQQTIRGIHMPAQAKGTYGASRGLLIAAGMRGLDQLYSHGIELGHIVWYARLSPWARRYIDTAGEQFGHTIVLRASEIVGSEDLMEALSGDGLEIGRDEDGIHYIVDKETGKKDRGRLDPEDSIDGS